MKTLLAVGVALAACLAGAPAMAASAMQPPMDNFNNAFYTCDNNGAFLISYDSNKPQNATITTDSQTKYVLKRTPAPMGVQFSADAVKFWTDGKTVTVEGTSTPYLNCMRKGG